MLDVGQSAGNPQPWFSIDCVKYHHSVLSLALYPLLIFILFRIAAYDIKTHLIRDLDLILLLISLSLILRINLIFGVAYFLILLLLNLLTKASIGFGDLKLALILGSAMNTVIQLVISIDIAWIIGGVWALISKRKSIPFAPAMILGAFLGQLSIGFR